MSWRAYLLLFLLSIPIVAVVASIQDWPGYMDADYYFATGQALARGEGFNEPFVWNYLDDPAGIPHPAFLYWMPLAGLVAASGMVAGGSTGFAAARLGFLLLACCLPPLTAAFAYRLTNQRRLAVLAGLLAVFPGFYLTYLATTDTFGLYMILGTGFLWVAVRAGQAMDEAKGHTHSRFQAKAWPFAIGLLGGLMHLARADGILWLGVGGAAMLGGLAMKRINRAENAAVESKGWFSGGRWTVSGQTLPFMLLLAGYLLVMSPWLIRNTLLSGSPFSPGSGRALWITDYDELYAFPASALTPARWWAEGGLEQAAQVRLWALGENLQTTLAVQGEIFLVPLALAGMWQHRKDPRVRLGALGWGLTFLGMTFIFPFQGARGGLFHSGAAIQPLVWALAPAGLERFVRWGERRRGWQPEQAFPILGAGLVILAALLTVLTAYPRLFGENASQSRWGQGEADYTQLEEVLKANGIGPGEMVLVNNPPGYFAATGRPAFAIPDGGEETLLAVARRYGISYLILEQNHPHRLEELFLNPADRDGLQLLFTLNETHVFSISIGDG